MTIIEANIDHDAEWSGMRRTLWPDCSEMESRHEIVRILESDREKAFLACDDDGRVIGFVEVSLRDYVEGATTTPVGYLEGIFVVPAHRGSGIGKRLVRAAESWALDRRCIEIGSDTGIDNYDSIAFHEAVGFRETDRQIVFVKMIEVDGHSE